MTHFNQQRFIGNMLIVPSVLHHYGAAYALKRFIQRRIETLIARKLIASEVPPRSTLEVVMENNQPAVYAK